MRRYVEGSDGRDCSQLEFLVGSASPERLVAVDIMSICIGFESCTADISMSLLGSRRPTSVKCIGLQYDDILRHLPLVVRE